jgi:GNAT superfamily N-acetyltransferase
VATVRRASLRDLDLLVRHRRTMWADIGGYSEAELRAADPVYRRWARTRLGSGALVFWIVAVDGADAASGGVWLQPVQPRPRWPRGIQPYLLSMYTEPEFRGRGFGRRIVQAATAWVKNEGYPRFTLHASVQGRGLYEGLGWERTWEMKIELGGRRVSG